MSSNKLQEYRDAAGQQLFESNAVRVIDNDSFLVVSATTIDKEYEVDLIAGHKYCSCPDYEKRSKFLDCKHIRAVECYLSSSKHRTLEYIS